MEMDTAQQQMRAAYVGGAPGVFVSGAVWLIAGFVLRHHGIASGFTALFIGGVMIFPLSLLLSKLLFKAPAVPSGNALNRLAIEGTVMLFAGIIIAYALVHAAPTLAFPAMALAMGARYFTFRTLYGDLRYWLLGGAIMAVATLAAMGSTALQASLALIVGGIEIVFAALIFVRWKRSAD